MSATVEIPGMFTAQYDDGNIVGFTFMPSASDAGYFGPHAIITDTTDEDDEGLDVESVDGPFWKAVQVALAGDVSIDSDSESIRVRWSE